SDLACATATSCARTAPGCSHCGWIPKAVQGKAPSPTMRPQSEATTPEAPRHDNSRGRQARPVARPGFKPGWGRQPLPGRFDSCCLPPLPRPARMTDAREHAMPADPDAPLSAGTAPRLTSLSHGGGCGCKIAPGVLADLLRRTAPAPVWPQLM